MKTSNKILSIAFISLFLSVILFLFIARANVSDKPITKSVDNTTIEKTLVENHDFEAFDLGFNNDYFFDETYEGVSVSGSQSAVNSIRISNKKPMRMYYEGDLNANKKRLNVRIGIKNKTGLDITVDDNAKCTTNAAYLDAKSLSADGNARIELNVKTDSHLLFAGGNGKVYGSIDASTVSATVDGNGRLYIDNDSKMKDLNISISGNGSITGGEADNVSGSIDGNGRLKLAQVNSPSNITESGNGRDSSSYKE